MVNDCVVAKSTRQCQESTVTKTPASLQHFGFFTLAQYSMIAFTNAIEILRMANYLSGEPLYRWTVYSVDGRPVAASNGLTVQETVALGPDALPDILFVCGGIDVSRAVDDDVVRLLRMAARADIALGGLCTGSYALARAGLLNGYRCAIHWENMSALRELFPSIAFSQEVFVVDRDRYTCSGGTAPIDLVLKIVTGRFGKTLAAGISDQFIVDHIRDDKDRQHIPMAARLGVNHHALGDVASLMENNIEEPLSLEVLAEMVSLSQRQLQRMFRQYLGMTPTQYYVNLRLRRARELLLQTSMSVMQVSVACGFQSPCHFTKSYRALFGCSPSSERRHSAGLDSPRPRPAVTQERAAT